MPGGKLKVLQNQGINIWHQKKMRSGLEKVLFSKINGLYLRHLITKMSLETGFINNS